MCTDGCRRPLGRHPQPSSCHKSDEPQLADRRHDLWRRRTKGHSHNIRTYSHVFARIRTIFARCSHGYSHVFAQYSQVRTVFAQVRTRVHKLFAQNRTVFTQFARVRQCEYAISRGHVSHRVLRAPGGRWHDAGLAGRLHRRATSSPRLRAAHGARRARGVHGGLSTHGSVGCPQYTHLALGALWDPTPTPQVVGQPIFRAYWRRGVVAARSPQLVLTCTAM